MCGGELKGVYEPHYKLVSSLAFYFVKYYSKAIRKRGIEELKNHTMQVLVGGCWTQKRDGRTQRVTQCTFWVVGMGVF